MSQDNTYSPVASLKPGKVTTIGVMTLVNGIVNILWSLGFTAVIVLGTLGIGILCAPVTILPLILGVFEIIIATRLLSDPPRPVKASPVIPILEICCILVGNVVSLVIGILSLVFYNEPEVQNYFASLSAQTS